MGSWEKKLRSTGPPGVESTKCFRDKGILPEVSFRNEPRDVATVAVLKTMIMLQVCADASRSRS